MFILFTIYLYLLAFVFFATILLILFDRPWENLPNLFLKFLERIQNQLGENYPDDYFERLPWKQIIEEKRSILECNNHGSSDFEVVEMYTEFPFNTHINLTRSGLDAILQDDFSGTLDLSPECQKYALNRVLWRLLNGKFHLRIVFVGLLLIRFAFIFPLRLLLYISSFVFLAICCVFTYFVNFSIEQKVFITRRYCRLYTAGIGVIAFFYGHENRPRPPGIAISNHLSANDIMVIASDIERGQRFLYTVTGQQHSGVIGFIQSLVSKICSALWLERSIADSRLKFLKQVLEVARHDHLVLMFPEGYCSNGTKVLQFRKAVFERNITIYPIAIQQNPRFGDAFWKEDLFLMYLLRLLSNFASIYHVHYLPPQTRMEDEMPEDFASRVQCLIAKVSNSHSIHFQGNLYYKATDREKYKLHLKKMCANEVFRLSAEKTPEFQVSASDGPA